MNQPTKIDREIRWGIIGTGKIARKFAEDLLRTPQGRLYSVASRTTYKATAFARQYKAEVAYGSYEHIIEDKQVDILYIATPHPFHFEWTLKGLQHGKAVLCEKPMGMDAVQVQRLTDVAQKQGLFLMEGLWTRFIPVFQKALEVLRSGQIGEPLWIRADFGFKGDGNLKSRIYNKSLGGGSLLDIGIYPLYLSLLVLGMPSKIQASARFTTTGVDSYCGMLLDYPSGAKANLESTLEADTPIEAHIYGSKGKLKLHSRFHHPEQCTLTLEEGSQKIIEMAYSGNGYTHEIEEVHQCLRSGKTESDLLPLSNSLKLAKIMDQVKAAIGLNYSTES